MTSDTLKDLLEEKPTCPSCNGRGGNTCFVDGRNADGSHYGDVREIACTTCGGTGRVTGDKLRQMRIGAAMREERVSARVSLKERADALGIGPADLSKIERGEGAASAYEGYHG